MDAFISDSQASKMNTRKLDIKIVLLIMFCAFGALAKAQSIKKQVQYLSGTDNLHTKIWDFWCTDGRKSGYWSKIQVPSCWEQQGFGAYNYGRDYVTYGKNFRYADEKGIYGYKFNVPKEWKGRTIRLVFEGSMTDTEVKVNGKAVGPVHRGAFYRFSYDVTGKIRFDFKNELKVRVSKMSSDSSVNNAERLADYWIFGGIFRPVYLEATPVEHISSTAIDARADGAFNMNVFLQKVKPGRTVTAKVLDKHGKVVVILRGNTNGDSVLRMRAHVTNPYLWTAETPDLYTVKVSLHSRINNLYETSEKFGFRTIEVRKNDGIYINGVKVKMKGINRHVWWPETGRTINAGIDLADVQLIKGMNMNAVRCSHYPPDQSFLKYCDSLGLYVLDELAGWQKSYSTKAGAPLVKEMVIRDRNHPSVIFWSNGNEGGHNFDLDNVFSQYDFSARPVIHAHHKPGNAFNGIDCNHYEDYYSTKRILADTNIYMVTEFLHAQDDGGGAAGLSDLWDLHWSNARGAGGFIWALLDEGIARTDHHGLIDVNGINAPDGILGPHREKEGSYNAIKEIFSPVKITMKELPDRFNGRIEVENRYHYTNLNQCSYRWELVDFHKPINASLGHVTAMQGRVNAPAISPGEKGNLQLVLPANWKNHDALKLTAYDLFKNEIYQWTWKVRDNTDLLRGIFTETGKDSVNVTENDTAVILKSNGISITISKKDGKLVKLANDYSKSLSFKNGPVLVAGNAAFAGLKYYKQKDAYIIDVAYTGDIKKLRWKMYPSGWLELYYEYRLDGIYPFSGISFSYPENYVFSAKWLGGGPYRVWKNRLQGASLNVWENINNNTQTGSSPWIYPEFKGYFGDIIWLELNTAEGKFTIATKDDGLFVRLFDFYGLSGPTPQPKLPGGDISFLDRIPPIAGKLAFNISTNTAALGPLSAPNNIHGLLSRTLYFYFGLPKAPTPGRQFTMPKENILTDDTAQ